MAVQIVLYESLRSIFKIFQKLSLLRMGNQINDQTVHF